MKKVIIKIICNFGIINCLVQLKSIEYKMPYTWSLDFDKFPHFFMELLIL